MSNRDRGGLTFTRKAGQGKQPAGKPPEGKPEKHPEADSVRAKAEPLKELYVSNELHAAMKRYCAQQDPPVKMVRVVDQALKEFLATKGYVL